MIIDHVKAEYAVMANRKETEVEGVVEEWRVYGKSADFKAIGEKYKIDQVVARVIRNRDIVTPQQYEEYINGDLSSLHSPWLLKDMEAGKEVEKAYYVPERVYTWENLGEEEDVTEGISG